MAVEGFSAIQSFLVDSVSTNTAHVAHWHWTPLKRTKASYLSRILSVTFRLLCIQDIA